MQAAGSLKKKRRRNLAKVTGLSVIPYDQESDNFEIRNIYSNNDPMEDKRPSLSQDLDQVRVHMSRVQDDNESIKNYFSRPSSRVTRDPRFSSDQDDFWASRLRIASAASDKDSIVGDNRVPLENDRPYLFCKNTMKRLRQVLILGIASFAFPWTWNEKDHRIEKWSRPVEKVWMVIWTLLAIQSTSITGFQIYGFFARMELNNGSYRPIFMNSFCVLWYTYAIACNICMFQYREQIRNYINTLLAMNKRFVDEFVIHTEGHKEGGQILLNISIPTNIGQVFISISLFIFMPFQPWYLYSYIYKAENPWYWLIPGVVQEFMVIAQILSVYLLIGWTVVGHANSVEFWLQEAHQHNETGYTRDGLRRPARAIEVYRSLQVLSGLFNNTMAPVAIPMVKMINWTALIPCGYVLIRSMNQKFIDEFPGILTYPFGVIDCVTSTYGILQIAAEMYDMAASFLNSWSQTRRKDLRTILISCPVLKVKVSGLYFVTVTTTIAFFKSIFDYIIDCIITFP